MANYKLLTHASVGTSSEPIFTASATNTVVSSITAKDGSGQTAEVLIQKSGSSSVIELAEVGLTSNAGFNVIDVAFALEAGDKVYIRSSRGGMKFIMSYVEEQDLPNDTALGGLADVDTTGVSDGDSLVYSTSNGGWGPAAGGTSTGGADELNDLDDVTVAGASSGDFLLHNGNFFLNSDFGSAVASSTSVFANTTKLNHITVTQAVDLDQMESDLAAVAGNHYTSSDFDTDLALKDTGDLIEGSNLYYTEARVSANADVVANSNKVSYTDSAQVSANTTKLSGIDAGATANDTDANLKDRGNHTGTQNSNTISDFTVEVESIIDDKIGSTGDLSEGSNLYYTDARVDARIGVAKIEDLDEVSSTAPSIGQVLKWDGSEWAPSADNSSSGGTGGVVDSVNGISQAAVVLDADDIDDSSTTHKFVTAADVTTLGNITAPSAVNLDSINTLATFAVTTANTAQGAITTHATSIREHGDVDYTEANPANIPVGSLLCWQGTEWKDQEVDLQDLANVDAPTTGEFLKWNGNTWETDAVSATPTATIQDADTALSLAGDYEAGARLIKLVNTNVTLTGGKVYQLMSSGWDATTNSSEAGSSGMMAVCSSDSSTGSAMILEGIFRTRLSISSASIGDPLYLGTNSEFTLTAPSSSATVVKMGYVVDPSNNMAYFNPDKTTITLQ